MLFLLPLPECQIALYNSLVIKKNFLLAFVFFALMAIVAGCFFSDDESSSGGSKYPNEFQDTWTKECKDGFYNSNDSLSAKQKDSIGSVCKCTARGVVANYSYDEVKNMDASYTTALVALMDTCNADTNSFMLKTDTSSTK